MREVVTEKTVVVSQSVVFRPLDMEAALHIAR